MDMVNDAVGAAVPPALQFRAKPELVTEPSDVNITVADPLGMVMAAPPIGNEEPP